MDFKENIIKWKNYIIDLFKNVDKRHHTVYSFAICISLCLIFRFIDYIYLWAFIVTMAIGIFKEYKDKNDPNHKAELGDVIADGIGALIAVALYGASGVW